MSELVKKQIQFAVFGVSRNQIVNDEVRQTIEGVMEHGWEMQDWKVVGLSPNQDGTPEVDIVICMTRELPIEKPKVVKPRGKKEEK